MSFRAREAGEESALALAQKQIPRADQEYRLSE